MRMIKMMMMRAKMITMTTVMLIPALPQLHEGAAPIMPDELKEEVCVDVRVVSKDQRLQPGHNAHG